MAQKELSSSVLTTKDAAIILGVSTGTVQKMMNVGALKGYCTSGGHRRIYADSLESYCKAKSIYNNSFSISNPDYISVVVIAENNIEFDVFQRTSRVKVNVITNPFELVILKNKPHCLIIDGMIPWINFESLHKEKLIEEIGKVFIFNSNYIDEAMRNILMKNFQMTGGAISEAVFDGMLIGLELMNYKKSK